VGKFSLNIVVFSPCSRFLTNSSSLKYRNNMQQLSFSVGTRLKKAGGLLQNGKDRVLYFTPQLKAVAACLYPDRGKTSGSRRRNKLSLFLLTLVMSLASNLSREVYKTSILTPETGLPTPIFRFSNTETV
jgi:hypothetical protein